MKNTWLMLLVMIPSCCQETCEAQSIVVSGQKQSIVVSGKSPVQAIPFVEVFQEQKPVVEKQPDVKPVSVEPKTKVRRVVTERYLVSEPWCGYCKPARAAFLASGGKEENIISIATARAMGHQWGGGVPHEFTVERVVVDQEAENPVQKAVQVSQPARYVQWPGWGVIDLETYNRNCNCSMCVQIRQMQKTYRQQMEAFRNSQTSVSPDQEGTPYAVVEKMLDEMQLRPDDVLGDLGCGDGRILVAAARRGIRGIGIELDPVRSEIARQNVAAAGVSHLVTIETGDALEFDTGRITAATAYLYPPLLEKLSPRLSGLRVVASPFHEIPGLRMTQAGDVWIARKS